MSEINPLSGTREAVVIAVRIAMFKRKVSGRALAGQIGMKQSTFSRRVAGEVAFTVEELTDVANALGVPITDLLPTAVTS